MGYGVALLVLPDALFRSGLRRELERCGFRTVVAPDWSATIDIAVTQAFVSVVFDPAQPAVAGVTWLEGLGRLRTGHADLIAFSLGEPAVRSVDPTRPNPTQPPSTTLGGNQMSRVPGVVRIVYDDPARVARGIQELIRRVARWQAIKKRFDELHIRLLAGDLSAPDEVWALVRPELHRRLRAWPSAAAQSDEAIADAVEDALIKYFTHPELYDSSRGHPIAWLLVLARNALRDRWRVRRDAMDGAESLGLDIDRGLPESHQMTVDEDPLERAERAAEARRRLSLAAPTRPERQLVEVKRARGSIAAQAAALGAGDLPLSEQRKLVHRTWNRIYRRLVRLERGGRADGRQGAA